LLGGESDEGGSLPGIEESLESELPSAEAALIAHAEEGQVEECMSRLSDRERLVCSLRMNSELSYEEIAEQTGQPIGTVKTCLYRIREKLTACLKAKAALNEREGVRR